MDGLLPDEEKEKYGLVVLRNPWVVSPSDRLRRQDINMTLIDLKLQVSSSVMKLAPRGYIIITTAESEEMDILTGYLKENNMIIDTAQNNSSPTQQEDRIILVAHKGEAV